MHELPGIKMQASIEILEEGKSKHYKSVTTFQMIVLLFSIQTEMRTLGACFWSCSFNSNQFTLK